jgi:type IX secretion system PorP/SprF family membrane protein
MGINYSNLTQINASTFEVKSKSSVFQSFSKELYKSNKAFWLFLITILSSLTALAQDDPQYSQNMYNRLPFNAGYAGSTGGLCATAIYRAQWVGFDGAPKTGGFSIDGLAPSIHGGLGLVVDNDVIAAFKTTSFKASYAYRMRLFTNGRLALGLSAGLVNKRVDASVFNSTVKDDPNIPNTSSSSVVDFGFGAYFNTNDFYFGVGADHLNQGKLDYTTNNSSTVSFTLQRTIYVMAGYNYPLSRVFTLKPSIFIKTYSASTQLDVNATLLYNNIIWAGVSYRLQDAVSVMAGVSVTNELKLGYAYDITTSSIKGYSSGSHEIMLRYCFKLSPKRPTYSNKTVRFL